MCARPATRNNNNMSESSKSDSVSHLEEVFLPKLYASSPIPESPFLFEDGKLIFEGEEATQHPRILPER